MRSGERESIVFVRARKAKGMPNRFSVREVFTQEEVEKSEGIGGVTSDADRPFKDPSDFYRRLLAEYLKVKQAGGKAAPAVRETPPADVGQGPSPEKAWPSPLMRPERREKKPRPYSSARAYLRRGRPTDWIRRRYAARGGDACNAVDPHEMRRRREESPSEIAIAPILYVNQPVTLRGPCRQPKKAISIVSLTQECCQADAAGRWGVIFRAGCRAAFVAIVRGLSAAKCEGHT